MGKLVNVLILLGAVGFLAAIVQRIFYIPIAIGLIPTAFLKFSVTSLVLAIALSVKK